jgi:hypothetical protein
MKQLMEDKGPFVKLLPFSRFLLQRCHSMTGPDAFFFAWTYKFYDAMKITSAWEK